MTWKAAMLTMGLVGALAATGAMAQTKQVDKASQRFISSAVQGDIAEVEMGKLAQEKSQSEAVKQFGAMLAKDHGEHKTKAEQAADQLGVKPPTGSSISQKATYAKLKMLSGTSFDKSFASAMVKDHQQDIEEYQKEASKDDAAGKLAKETLTILQASADGAVSRETDRAEIVPLRRVGTYYS
jgi:putative membrane protein